MAAARNGPLAGWEGAKAGVPWPGGGGPAPPARAAGGVGRANREACGEAVSRASGHVCVTKNGRMLKSRRAVNGAGGDSHVVQVRMDGFFAAVEQVRRTKFGGRPVLVADRVVV